jgi:UDP-glucose 4-epimerase
MRALVTGGAGFIGSSIVRLLLQEGHDVVVLDDLSSGYKDNLVPEATFVEASVIDDAAVRQAMDGCGVVFHLAASVGNTRSIDDPVYDASANVIGTINVLQSARQCGISRIVLSSSAGIFGELKTLPIDEDHPQDPDSPYGVSKLAAEKLCLVYNKLYGMRNVCLRYFNVYGVRQRYDAYGNVIPIFAERMLRHQPVVIFGDGEQTRDFVHVGDVAAANVGAGFADAAKGAYNIGSGTRISINQLAETMARLTGQEVQIAHGDPRPGDVRDSLAEVGKARREFGFAPATDIEGGLAEYLSWLQQDELTLRRWSVDA